MKKEPSKVEYWNERVRNAPNEKDMLFLDPRREEFWERVRHQLALWKQMKVVDVCCGYGQFARFFAPENYIGIDFSEEMLKLANEKFPNRSFRLTNVQSEEIPNGDVIFEVNSLHSLGWTPEQFYERFKNKAKIIACLEADRFTIFQNYG